MLSGVGIITVYNDKLQLALKGNYILYYIPALVVSNFMLSTITKKKHTCHLD